MSEPRTITRADIDQVLAEHPKLGEWGYDHPDARARANLDAARESLRGQVAEVQAAHDWLLTLHPIAEGERWPTSYGLKHDGEHSKAIPYVTNGAMIVAAFLAGVSIRLNEGPNPSIGLSLTAPKPQPAPGSFTAWLQQYEDEQHPIGDLARDVRDDDTWPVEGATVDDVWPADAPAYHAYRDYLLRVGASDGALSALREAWTAYSGSVPDESSDDQDYIKLTANITHNAHFALRTAADLSGDTRTDTLNRALVLYGEIMAAVAAGGSTIKFEDREGNTHRIQVY